MIDAHCQSSSTSPLPPDITVITAPTRLLFYYIMVDYHAHGVRLAR